MGPRLEESKSMLSTLGFNSFDDLVKSTVPANIMIEESLKLDHEVRVAEVLEYGEANCFCELVPSLEVFFGLQKVYSMMFPIENEELMQLCF